MDSSAAAEPWPLIDRLVLLLAARSTESREALQRVLTPERLRRLAETLTGDPDDPVDPDPFEARDLAASLLAHERPLQALRGSEVLDPEALARELLERSRRVVATDPRRAELAASLAFEALEGASPVHGHLRLAAIVFRANALRHLDLSRAGGLLDSVESALDAPGSLRLRGDLHLLAALVRQDQGLFARASTHLRSALAAYSSAGDRGRLARLLVHAGSFLRRGGDLGGAVSAASAAVELAESTGDGETLLAARHNLAVYRLDAGETEGARDLLLGTVRLHRDRPGSRDLVQHRWLSARLAAATGDLRGAASAYEGLEGDLREAGRFREAALVLIERAWFEFDLQDRRRARRSVAGLLDLAGELPPGTGAEVRRLLAELDASGLPFRLLLHRLTALLRDA